MSCLVEVTTREPGAHHQRRKETPDGPCTTAETAKMLSQTGLSDVKEGRPMRFCMTDAQRDRKPIQYAYSTKQEHIYIHVQKVGQEGGEPQMGYRPGWHDLNQTIEIIDLNRFKSRFESTIKITI